METQRTHSDRHSFDAFMNELKSENATAIGAAQTPSAVVEALARHAKETGDQTFLLKALHDVCDVDAQGYIPSPDILRLTQIAQQSCDSSAHTR